MAARMVHDIADEIDAERVDKHVGEIGVAENHFEVLESIHGLVKTPRIPSVTL